MERGAAILLVSMLLASVLAVSALATHIESSTPIPRKISPFEEEEYPPPPRPTSVAALPDLIVSRIVIPDELPLYTVIESFEIDVTNIGNAPASGKIEVYMEMRAPNIPRCALRISVGQYSGGRIARHTYIQPGETVRVLTREPYHSQSPTLPWVCRRPLAGDLIIHTEVNPAMGGQVGPVYRGRLRELSRANNVREKRVRVSEDLDEWTIPIKFVKGLNAFSVPVKSNTLAKQFSEVTGCALYKPVIAAEKAMLGLRTVDVEALQYVSSAETLKAGEVYFAQCRYGSTFHFIGPDPERLHIDLPGKGLKLVGTRAGMTGRRIYELVKGCGNPWALTRYHSIVPGERTAIRKMLVERLHFTTPIVPGLAYSIYCPYSNGGVWDSKDVKRYPGEPIRLKAHAYYPARPPARRSSYRYPSGILGSRGGRLYTYRAGQGDAYTYSTRGPSYS